MFDVMFHLLIDMQIGNPLLNYGIDTSATYSFLWSHGVISDETFHGVSRWCDFRYGYMGGEESIEDEERWEGKKEGCTSFLASARNEMGSYINIYDVTADVCPPPILHQAILLHKLVRIRAFSSFHHLSSSCRSYICYLMD